MSLVDFGKVLDEISAVSCRFGMVGIEYDMLGFRFGWRQHCARRCVEKRVKSEKNILVYNGSDTQNRQKYSLIIH